MTAQNRSGQLKTNHSGRADSGQVLLAGVIMIVVLLLCILYMFDIHNVIRGKIKVETGQQAAALTGAVWQRNSLNLIGEINLFKACSALLEGEEKWSTALPAAPAGDPPPQGTPAYTQYRDQLLLRRQALQGRVDLLTEMQTRIAFIGPLIGFASAQQAAKANGLPRAPRRAMENYLRRVISSYRYEETYGGARNFINNYRWRDPYITLLSEISQAGIAVYPNVRTARAPIASPPQLAMESFYLDLLRHGREIAAGDPPEQSTWRDTVYNFAKDHHTWNDSHLKGKWWNIDFSISKFPDESEIFTLGVRNGFSNFSSYQTYDDRHQMIGRTFWETAKASPDAQNSLYRTLDQLPSGVDMKWFCYDESWYPEYYRSVSENYDEDHHDYWFNRQALRKKVKSQYIYEGPAAYVEGADVYMNRVVRQGARRSPGSPVYDRGRRSIRLGPKHDLKAGNEHYATDYRPGAIAKTLGELANGNPPTAVPLVMPVFDKVVLMPTYMPIPYGFSVLRDYNSLLDEFLNWLAAEESLTDPKHPLPGGCEDFLEALKLLSDRKTFLNYGYNPDCTVQLDIDLLRKWEKIRKNHLYTQANPSGLGWLQEPRLCKDTFNQTRPKDREVQVTDYLNGGLALRIYTDNDDLTYYVIDSNGKIITNDDLDPTVRYNYGGPDCNCCGPGFGRPSGKPDLQKGPPRL